MSVAATITVERIDAELPQTQCGKCGHDGCRPYAEAIVEGEAINRCPPGGDATRDRLAALTGRPPLELIEPPQPPLLAVIREAECIGCTKCIQACPVDAILGAAKQMHTVIESECTGCELCVAPCPVDCIDLIEHPRWVEANSDVERQRYLDWRAHNGRQRFDARNHRLAVKAEEKRRKREKRTAAIRTESRPVEPETTTSAATTTTANVDTTALKAQRATLMARLKRTQRQLDKADDTQRPALLERLAGFEEQLDTLKWQLETAPSPNRPAARDRRHIALAAAEQALRKARQELEHYRRQSDQAGIAEAQDKIREAERLISLASRSPANQPTTGTGDHHGTSS